MRTESAEAPERRGNDESDNPVPHGSQGARELSDWTVGPTRQCDRARQERGSWAARGEWESGPNRLVAGPYEVLSFSFYLFIFLSLFFYVSLFPFIFKFPIEFKYECELCT